MREILFKAKHKNWRELPKEEWWVEGYPVKYQPCASKEEWIYGIVPTYASALYIIEIDPETLCQYIYMNDKNGKRIWENDIVDASEEWWDACGPAEHNSPIIKVEWLEGLTGFDPFANYDCDCGVYIDSSGCEVIGNIFDDKHLLAETDYCWEQEQETEDSHGE